MKKYFAGLAAVAFAVVCFAFTSVKSEGTACTSTTIYWFKVKTTINKTACNSLVQSDLLLPVDAGTIGTIDVPAEAPQGPATIVPFACPDQNLYVCALAFDANQVERVQDPSNPSQFIWRPKSSELASFKCCVKRPLNP
jgi:hypothetical protein